MCAKGATRSGKMWTKNFYKIFFQKYFAVHERLAVKNSFSKYIVRKLFPARFILIESVRQ